MALTIICAHAFANAAIYVVTGLPGSPPPMSGQCPTGAHADVPGGWRITIPLACIPDRKRAYSIAPCADCVTAGRVDAEGVSTCMCTQGGCCETALKQLLLEHCGLFVGLPIHTDATLVAGVNPGISGLEPSGATVAASA